MSATGDDHPSDDFTRAGEDAADDVVTAASVVLLRGEDVLLVERATGAAAGRWSLPGGHLEPGETAEAAARRELAEETGLTAGPLVLVAVHRLSVDVGLGARRYAISVFAGRAAGGVRPLAASDARRARFHEPAALAALPLTDGLLPLIGRARAMIGDQRRP